MKMPMGSGIPTGPRGGTHWSRGSNIPTPRYHRHRVTHAGSYLCTNVRFLSQLYFKPHPHEPIFPRQIHPCHIFVKSKLCQFGGKFSRCFFAKWKKTEISAYFRFNLLLISIFYCGSKRKCKLASQFFWADFA